MSRTYETFERFQIFSALIDAQARIWDGQPVHGYYTGQFDSICKSLPDNLGGKLAKEIIMERLGGYFGVRSWLYHNGFLDKNYGYWEEVQAYRKAWLAELIKEFSK